MTEPELITAAKAGDQDAFAELYRRMLPNVKAVGRRILRTGDLDDLCQEVFLRAFTRLDRFRGDATFRTWITRIAATQCFMVLRRGRQVSNGDNYVVDLAELEGRSEHESDLLDNVIFAVEDVGLRSLPARLDLPKMLACLKPIQRDLVTLAYLDDVPVREIAATRHVTIATVKSKLYHAKKRVRETWG